MLLAHAQLCFPKVVTDFDFGYVIYYTSFFLHPWSLVPMITQGKQTAQFIIF